MGKGLKPLVGKTCQYLSNVKSAIDGVRRAEKFGVRPSAICYALKKMKVTRKKKELRYRERNREERIKYYRVLRELIKIY